MRGVRVRLPQCTDRKSQATSYTYDGINRLTQITQGSSTTTYMYDAAGRRTSLTLPNGVLVEYAYDNASRLTEITYKQNVTTVLGNLTYEYDKAANRIKTGGSFARTGIPDSVSSSNYNAANQPSSWQGLESEDVDDYFRTSWEMSLNGSNSGSL